MTLLLACLGAYLLGGVPFGLVLVRVLKGVDIRQVGSGNVGATNASRAFGGMPGLSIFALIYVLDFAKGFVPTMWGAAWAGLDASLSQQAALGACAVVGHCASPYLRFRGGKGVATTTGVFAALEPVALVIAIAAFFATLALKRQVFWGSLALGTALALAVVLRDPGTAFAERLPSTVLALAAAAFLVFTHRSNIRRFLSERSAEASA